MSEDHCDLLCLDLSKAEALRAKLPSLEVAERAAVDAKALADPTRVMLAAALATTDELCVCDLAWISGRAENLVSHHVRALRTAGLASSRREGKMVLYSMTERGKTLLSTISGLEVVS